MDLKNFFSNSSNEVYEHNMDLLEDYDLINPFGSPNKLFLKFLKSKNLEIKKDRLTPEIIDEFEDSVDSTNLKLARIRKEKEIIFNQRKVWINIPTDGEAIGDDLILDSDGIIIRDNKTLYSKMLNIEIAKGSWSKNKFIIHTKEDEDIIFEINENKAVPLKEIIEDNIAHQNHDEFDDLLDLYALYDEGKISEEELEVRKAIIYSDDRYCTNCGFKLESDSEFCTNCGHQVFD